MKNEIKEPAKEKGAQKGSSWIPEFIIWIAISVLYQLEGILAAGREVIGRENMFLEFLSIYLGFFSFKLVIGVVIIVFPFIFRSIFGFYPLRLLKELLNERTKQTSLDNKITFDNKEIIDAKPITYLHSLIEESNRIATNIYTRSNLYLLVGTLIAISGILFFTFQTSSFQPETFNYTQEDIKALENLLYTIQNSTGKETSELGNNDVSNIIRESFFDNKERKDNVSYINYLLTFIPRFGALFFIEFIAFFFLKQYRNSMDEFKYYESVKRNRQQVLLKAKYLDETNLKMDMEKINSIINLTENPDLLTNNQTSELIEKRKLTKDEVSIMGKIVDSIVKIKG